MNYGIIVAAGKSQRMGPKADKAFLCLGTKPVLAYSLMAFEKCPDIDGVILVARKERVDGARGMAQMYGCAKVKKVVAGGAQRQISVMNGMAHVPEDVKIVTVHDGARPCLTPELISQTIKAAKRYGSGVAAVPISDTVKLVERGMTVSKTLDRSKLWRVQTPQSFKKDLLDKAFETVRKKGLKVTDEASAVEAVGGSVRLVASILSNVKITTTDDLPIAAALLKL